MECKKSKTFWKKTTFITLTVAVFVSAMYLGSAYSKQHRESIGTWYITSELNLSEEQKVKFEQLKDELKSAREKYQTDHTVLRHGFLELVENNNVTEEKLNQLVGTGKESFQKITVPVLQKIVAFNISLDEKQRKEVSKHLREHFNRQGNDRNSRHGHNHGWL